MLYVQGFQKHQCMISVLCSTVSPVHMTCNRNRVCHTPWTILAVGKPLFQDRPHVTPLFTPSPHSSTLQSVLGSDVTPLRDIGSNRPTRLPESPGDSLARVTSATKDAPKPPPSVRPNPLRTPYIHSSYTWSISSNHCTWPH
jgi:hypothetical protein